MSRNFGFNNEKLSHKELQKLKELFKINVENTSQDFKGIEDIESKTEYYGKLFYFLSCFCCLLYNYISNYLKRK